MEERIRDAAAVRGELDRILSGRPFVSSPRMSRFLKFVVEETLAGNGERLKEYVIAIEVFEKPPEYDPRTDSTVRTEASKLRARLERYYQTEGQQDTLIISIPKGRYVPVFSGTADEIVPGPASVKATLPRSFWIGTATLLGIVAAAAVISIRESQVEPPRLAPLTTFAGHQLLPAFSPDGKQVAFLWNGEKQDNWGLYVKLIDSVAALHLATSVVNNVAPAWSPDGRQIVFVKPGPGEGLYSTPPLGGSERKIAAFNPGGSTVSWSPDGKFIVAAKFYSEFGTEPGSGGLFLIPSEGGQPRQLLVPQPGRWYESPMVSPSGRAIAFVSCQGAKSQRACALNTLGWNADLSPQGEPQELKATGQWFAGLSWSADSRSLIFGLFSGGTQSANNLYLWRINTARSAVPTRLDNASTGALYPAASLRGDRLAFSRMLSDTDVWRLEPGRPPSQFLVSSMADGQAQFSPDGRRIVFVSGRGMDGERIWITNADGTSPERLTAGGDEGHGSPRWSPDGRTVAFDAFSKRGRTVIKIVDTTDRQSRQLTDGKSNDGVPSWSHDGQWIYFRSDRSGRSEVWRMRANGGPADQVTNNGGNVPVEAPDGRTLYYTKTGGDGPVFARTIGDRDERQVLARVVTGRGFAVFSDGLYYLDYRGDPNADAGLAVGDPAALARLRKQYEIRFLRFHSRETRVISRLDGWPSLGFSVSPDRRTFLFTQWRDVGINLMQIENFR